MLENRTIAAFNSSDTTSAWAQLRARFGSACSACRASSWRSRRTGFIEPYRYNPSPGSRARRPCGTSLSNGSLGPNVQQAIQLLRKMSGRGILDKRLGCIQQSALAGAPHGPETPHAVPAKVRGFIQRVVAATVGVAGPIGELLQFAEDGDIHLGSQRPLQLGQGRDLAPDRKSTRLNSSHRCISYAVFCLKKKK